MGMRRTSSARLAHHAPAKDLAGADRKSRRARSSRAGKRRPRVHRGSSDGWATMMKGPDAGVCLDTVDLQLEQVAEHEVDEPEAQKVDGRGDGVIVVDGGALDVSRGSLMTSVPTGRGTLAGSPRRSARSRRRPDRARCRSPRRRSRGRWLPSADRARRAVRRAPWSRGRDRVRGCRRDAACLSSAWMRPG